MSTARSGNVLLALAASVACALALPARASAAIELGVFTPGAPASAEALQRYATEAGRQPAIVMWFREFGQDLMYSNESRNLTSTGQTPMITWEPSNVSLASIAAGGADEYLHQSALAAKRWGRPLMIRFAHEMNGRWFPWGHAAPEVYIASWRHIVSLFRADGADNVQWVWSPNADDPGTDSLTPYFPGDAWVDYVGLDGYNWGATRGQQWQSFHSVFAPSYETVTRLTDKPVVIAETASSEAGGDKGAWIRDAFMSTIPKDFPRVEAVVWFNKAQEQDWRITSSAAAHASYRSVVGCVAYGGLLPCGEGVLPLPWDPPVP